jgi:hypothetical protein
LIRPGRAVWIGLLLISLASCAAPPPDEERIRAILDDMTKALAERDTRAVLEPLADDFYGETWELDDRALRLLLQREIRARQQLNARLFDVEIEILGDDRARATFQALLTGGSGLIPSDGRWFRVETGWRRDDDWALISASWEDVIGR